MEEKIVIIKDLLSKNELGKVFEYALTEFKYIENIGDEFIKFKQEYTRISESNIQGILTYEELSKNSNKLTSRILKYLNHIKSEHKRKGHDDFTLNFKEVEKLFMGYSNNTVKYSLEFKQNTDILNSMIKNSYQVSNLNEAGIKGENEAYAYFRKKFMRMKKMQESLISSYGKLKKEHLILLDKLHTIIKYLDNPKIEYSKNEIRSLDLSINLLDKTITHYKKELEENSKFFDKLHKCKNESVKNINLDISALKTEKVKSFLIKKREFIESYYQTGLSHSPFGYVDIRKLEEIKGELVLSQKEILNSLRS